MIYDITPPITPDIKVWPGDTPMSREIISDLKTTPNAIVTLSTLHATVHLGAHADGPNHYGKDAQGIGEQPIEPYLGRCQVIEAGIRKGKRIFPSDLDGGIDQIREQRVLIRTGTFPDHTKWNDDFAALSPDLIDALARKRVMLVGVDTPSVDLFSDKKLEAHHTILKHKIAILEGLVLRGVPQGSYELIALPLKLIGFDASPVRAILRTLSGR